MQNIVLRCAGLYTNASDLGGTIPDGSLSVANEIVIDKDNIAEPRRGFDRSYGALSDTSYRAKKLFFYQNYLFALDSGSLLNYYTTILSTTTANFTGTGAFTSVGSYPPPSGVRTRTAQSNQNLYYTTSSGVYKLDAYNSTPKLAGAYKALDIQTATANVTGNWLTDAYYTAYRVLWGYRDANNNLILGAPSGRSVLNNTAGAARAVNIIATVPAGVTTAWFYQVYRAASGTVEPGDEMGLVYEGIPTAGSFSSYSKTFVDAGVNTGTEVITSNTHGFTTGDMVFLSNSGGALPGGLAANTIYYVIGATTNTLQLSTTFGGSAVNITSAAGGGTHTITGAQQIALNDIVPDSLRGATLYTSATQQGISQANESPPLAKDIAVYKGTTFYANTTSKYRYTLTLLSASALAVDDTLTIGGITYTVKGSEAVASAQFKQYSGGSTTSIDIRNTAQSLVRVINQYSSSTVYAYYLSGTDDLPGKILLEARSLGAAAFTVTSTNTTAWSPSISSAQSATNDAFLHGLFYSKSNQPEAVPLVNFFYVGDARKNIQRILPLRDSLFILKEDGIYRLSGDDANSFRVDLFDSTAKLLAPETAVVLNNQIFALTDQGVVSITESGVAVRSRPIESTLLALQGVNLSVLQTESFAVAYETERKYILFVPSTSGDTGPSQAFVFNTFTSAWTRWALAKTCGVIGTGDDKLYLGNAADSYLFQERKSLTYTDCVDYGSATIISAVSGTTVSLTASDTIVSGDVIWQTSTLFGVVASVDSIAGTVTMQYAVAFTNAAAIIYKAINTRIAWVPITANNPGALKQFRDVSFMFKTKFVGTAYAYFYSDLVPSLEYDTLSGSVVGAWGIAPWGSGPWGGDTGRLPPRCYVPRNMQRATQLTIEFRHAIGYSTWQLQGLSVSGNFGSERVSA